MIQNFGDKVKKVSFLAATIRRAAPQELGRKPLYSINFRGALEKTSPAPRQIVTAIFATIGAG